MSPPVTQARSDIEHLYRRHRGWLHQWLSGQLGCPHRAADLAQDTFIRLLLKEATQSSDQPATLLKTIARGLVIDHWRRSAVEKAYLEALATLPPQCTPSPEQQIQAREALQRVDAMLEGLKPQVRNAFLLYRLAGLEHHQIAEQMGVTVRSIERYVASAMLHCYHLRFGQE